MGFHKGYKEAKESLHHMSKEDLIKYLESQYGVPNWIDINNIDELILESIQQCMIDFCEEGFNEAPNYIKSHWKKLLDQ